MKYFVEIGTYDTGVVIEIEADSVLKALEEANARLDKMSLGCLSALKYVSQICVSDETNDVGRRIVWDYWYH